MDATPVIVTEKAAQKALALAEREGVPAQLRLGVRGGGCSGLSYFFEFEKPPKPGDTVWDAFGLQVCIDAKSQKFLAGCILDFEDSGLLKRGFRFKNPNAKQSCSCGDSFTL